jgi:hypothetical protein
MDQVPPLSGRSEKRTTQREINNSERNSLVAHSDLDLGRKAPQCSFHLRNCSVSPQMKLRMRIEIGPTHAIVNRQTKFSEEVL